MADEFDLKPTSRGEEFLDVILRSLGGDTPDIPQPAWRYEEYLAAIANAIQNGGGGGSSGGGVLVVRGTYDEDTEKTTLDKTWNEIHTAAATMPVVIVLGSGDTIDQYPLYRVEYYDGEYSVSVREGGANAGDNGYYMNDWIFGCAGENDYPVYPYIPK